MLKIRIIPTLLYKGFGLVKGTGFDSWRPVGAALQAVKVYNMREVDELVLLDIAATAESRPPEYSLIRELASECFMPMTAGGGVRGVDEARLLLQAGADKVCMGSEAVSSPGSIASVARRFGRQCVVVSIDYRQHDDGPCEVFTHCGTIPTGKEPVECARDAEAHGAGEILLQSIDRDGGMAGYDVETIRRVCGAVSIPVIASGGAGTCEHMAEAILKGGASAVAAAAMFHFTQHTPREAKAHLHARGIPVRL